MQLRLTVLGPQCGSGTGSGRGAPGTGADVTVSAPAGTPLASVLSGLAEAVAPGGGPPGAVFCGARRLDPRESLLGRPPLVDGAVLAFQHPAEEALPERARARLLVTSGPDAGGVHLLHGGEIRLGRSAEAEVPLDDPDVSRLHCVITVAADASLTVHDPGSTNGTSVNGGQVGRRPVALPFGAELRVGESVLRVFGEEGPGAAGAPEGAGAVPHEDTGGGAAAAAGGSARGAHGWSAAVPGAPALPMPELPPPAGGAPAGPEAAEPGRRKRPGWARRLGGLAAAGAERTGGAAASPPSSPHPGAGADPGAETVPPLPPAASARDARWPDPATVLLTAIESGPLLWSRDAAHHDALTVRLGTAQRASGPLVPVTVNLAAAGSLGLAGPRSRLTALARSVLAQLAGLHRPGTLELVVVAPGRAADWSWLGWLPQTRPESGQQCHRLLAFDAAQAAARLGELTARLDRPASEAGRATVVLVDGALDAPRLGQALTRLAMDGPAAGIHLLALAEAPTATPASPLSATLAAAARSNPSFADCGMTGVLAGEVATAVRLLLPEGEAGPPATIDGVSAAWAERFARALAPGQEPAGGAGPGGGEPAPVASLPGSARLLDVLELPRVTPGALQERWTAASGLPLLLGTGGAGPVRTDLAAAPGPLLISGPPRSGRTELLCSLAAALAAARGPRELSLILIDGADEGLAPCAELPQVVDRLRVNDPVRMRAFTQALRGELARRAALLGERAYTEPRAERQTPPGGLRVVAPRSAGDDAGPLGGAADADGPLPRLVVLADDVAALRAPALGDPGRPAAGSVVRVLEAVVREGRRLGVHLIAVTEPAAGDPVWSDGPRLMLSGAPAGRGELRTAADAPGQVFQAGRVTGRIPRTGTLRPTVVPLDWHRAGDPPARRPVRELGNGPTDIALLASAAARAARPKAAPAAASPA